MDVLRVGSEEGTEQIQGDFRTDARYFVHDHAEEVS